LSAKAVAGRARRRTRRADPSEPEQAKRESSATRGPGRPSTGARERILEACLEALREDGYAGLTVAKVAARAGVNKALVSYHFGSKQGAIAAAARELGRIMTTGVLVGLDGARTVEEIVRGSLDATWKILERDGRLARVYFDLNAVSIVEDDVRAVMRDVKDGWRNVLSELLRDADDGIDPKAAGAASVYLIAGIEGLCLEWIERGDTPALRRAKDLFVRASVAELTAETPAPA
jgi:TetR/AcrR family transcriptional regulator, transcriptional repressor of bet genes